MIKGTGEFLQPEKVLEQLDFSQDMKVAEFGCGHGYFVIPLAKVVGKNGRVYALDVQSQALEAVKSKAALEGLANIETIHCNLELNGNSKLKDSSIDLVLIANTLFQSQKKAAMIQEAERVLKSQGQLVIIDWLAEAPLAPKEGWLISQEEVKDLVETEGFKFKKELDLDNQHYGSVFVKT